MSLSADISNKGNDLLPNYCFFYKKKALQEFQFEGNLYKGSHLMDESLFYLQWFQSFDILCEKINFR